MQTKGCDCETFFTDVGQKWFANVDGCPLGHQTTNTSLQYIQDHADPGAQKSSIVVGFAVIALVIVIASAPYSKNCECQ